MSILFAFKQLILYYFGKRGEVSPMDRTTLATFVVDISIRRKQPYIAIFDLGLKSQTLQNSSIATGVPSETRM